MFKQIGDVMDIFFSNFNVALGKATARSNALIEKWKSATDKGKSFGALLTDLCKAFDCLPHERPNDMLMVSA